jgi:glutaredoxin-related protein
MAGRPILEEKFVSPAALSAVEGLYANAQNPHVRKVRKALDEAGISHTYLEYGSYFSEWRKRLAIKLWSGWPTFPQVFVRGVLIGGEDLTRAALADGSLKSSIAAIEAAPATA